MHKKLASLYSDLDRDRKMAAAAGSSRQQSPTKRLITELRNYQNDPNDVLEQLGPVSDDELMHWTAILTGVIGTAYEGMCSVLFHVKQADRFQQVVAGYSTYISRQTTHMRPPP
jgi:hypothetical protein